MRTASVVPTIWIAAAVRMTIVASTAKKRGDW
jgi:hypothetical protein